MDNLLYNSCVRYFTSLANYGFKNEMDVKKLLFYVFIQELVNTTSIVISETDYKSLENALYSLYGTTCLMPYPDYCERPMYAHLGDIAELSARMAKAEEKNTEQDKKNTEQDSRISSIEETNVVKDEAAEEITVDDIIINGI